jgi:hypothetical protein
MIAHLIAGTKRAFGLQRPGRNLVILPDDVFIVSYPKSGNTWARFLLANLVHPEQPANFANINRLVPDPHAATKRYFEHMPRPRIIKNHECFDPRFPRAIYIVRDPRDVAISQYHYQRKRRVIEDKFPLPKYIERFLAGEVCVYGSWGDNVASWLATRHSHSGFLLLRYEDMVADTACELAKVASFLGVDATPQRLLQAVERSSADKMRSLEKEQSHLCSLTKDTRQDLPFVRAAKSGGWKSELSESMIADIEAKWAPLMTYLGYDRLTPETSRRAGSLETLLKRAVG